MSNHRFWRSRRSARLPLLVAVVALAAFAAAAIASADDNPTPIDFTHHAFNAPGSSGARARM